MFDMRPPAVLVQKSQDQRPLTGWFSRHQGFLGMLTLVLTLGISASWLVFPYFVKGQNLLLNVGGSVKEEKLSNSIAIGKFLTRTTFGAGEAQVDMLYATSKFFEVTGQAQVVSQYRPDLYHVFIVTETTHIEDLPTRLPSARLTVDGLVYEPVDVEGPLEVYHHRVVTVRFPALTEDGSPTISDTSATMQLELVSDWDYGPGSRIASWDLPLEYPDQLAKENVWTPLMVLGLSAGLLSFVLTPCLIQLLVVYLVTLTGLSTDLSSLDSVPGSARRQILGVGAGFALGFSLLFTSTGAFIGYAGKSAQIFFAVWSPTLTVSAGILVTFMGLWVGVRSRAPIVCRLAPEKLRSRLDGRASSYFGAGLTSIGFSLGCMTCFGGAIIATLLVYVGALGSALVGAGVMFAFSMGIVIPFLLAALFLSRTLPLLHGVHRHAPTIGFVSMLIMVTFGVVLVTDNFHVLSDFIYPYLGLG